MTSATFKMAAPMLYHSDEEANAAIKAVEVEDGVSFVVRKSKFTGISRVENIQRLLFEDYGRSSVPVTYDGTPFTILSSDIRECRYGSIRVQTKEDNLMEGDHTFGKATRRHFQPTMKKNCQAKVKLRRIIKFPEYKIEGPASKWKRLQVTRKLKAEFNPDTMQQYCVIVQFVGSHTDHFTGNVELSAYTNRLDKRVIGTIKGLAKEGMVNVTEVHRRAQQTGEELAPSGTDHCDHKFFPNRKDVYNHIYRTMADTGPNNADQLKLAKLVDEWKEASQEGDSIYFRQMSERDQLLFVYQTSFQKNLLHKYGKELCLLDSTYGTTKYTCPLSFVCVRTNVGYQVVASFVVAKETTANITEALQIVSDWNSSWNPEFWLTDFDQREISSLEKLFPDTCVLLCDFHREQAWQRWLGAKKNGVSQEKDTIIKQMRIVARCSTETAFNAEVSKLRDLDVYTTHAKFRNWLDKQWLSECKRWVSCFRQCLLNISINTTNGAERMHKLLKEKYLKEKGFGGTLTSLLTVLVKSFFPEMQAKYIKSNVLALEQTRSYSQHLPNFLKGKPKPFIDHCVRRMAPNAEFIHQDEISKQQSPESLKFTVSQYEINYEHQVPYCSCPDFAKSHWPCKHVLAIFSHFPEHGWDTLHKSYINQPCFNLDFDVLRPIAVDEPLPSIDKPNAFIPNTDNFVEKKPDNDTNHITVTPTAVRKSCVEVLKNVQNNLYSISDVKVLSEVHEKLSEIDLYLDDHAVKICGLPTRRKLKSQNLKIRKTTVGKRIKRQKLAEEIVENDDYVCQSQEMLERIQDVNHSPAHTRFLKDVDSIWESSSCQQYNIGKVGPYVLTVESVKFLQTTLSDEVLDAYLHLLTQSRNVFHISSVVMTAIFMDTREIHSLLRKETLCGYEYCIGAVNQGGNHWTLMGHPMMKLYNFILSSIQMEDFHGIYLRPLGSSAFVHARTAVVVEKALPGTWTIESPPHAKQADGLSCGVYVLMLAERFLNGQSLQFSMKKDELVGVRKTIAVHLLNNAVMIEPTVDDGIPAVEEAAQSKSQPPIEQAVISAVEEAAQFKSQPPVDKANIPADELASQPPVEKSRKRKRKDKRKSSFVYSKQKKSSRIYCVCRKRNDGRLYWHCDSCNEWYHPDCMGFDEKEEPRVYTCPSCQVKIERKACPTLQEVEEKLRKDIELENSDPMDETFAGGLQDHPGTTPVFLNHPHVRFFIEIKKKKEQEVLIKSSGWGEFVLMSDNDFDNYELLRNKLPEDLLILDSTLEYFLSVCVKEKVEVLYYTDCIVRLLPSNVIDQYKEWLEEAKCSLHLY